MPPPGTAPARGSVPASTRPTWVERPWVRAVVVIALVAAVLLLPWTVAGLGPGGGYAGPDDLRDALARGAVATWRDGGQVDATLADVVAFWRRFHLIKALLALVLTVVLLRDALAARRRRWRVPLFLAAAFAALVVLANVQGVAAPLSSAWGLLDLPPRGGDLAAMVRDLRSELRGGDRSAFTALVQRDFVRYHAVVAALSVVAGVALAVVVARCCPRRGPLLATAAAVLLVGVLAAANLDTVRDPEPALIALLDGGH